jgi:hypothetical protein
MKSTIKGLSPEERVVYRTLKAAVEARGCTVSRRAIPGLCWLAKVTADEVLRKAGAK